jgi:S1-C subfamily serine protease
MKLYRTPLAVVLLLAIPALGLGPRAQAQEFDSADLYGKVVNSCVFIIQVPKDKRGFAMGSGSLIDAEKRYIITNHHVVDDSDFVHVQFPAYVKGKMITDKKIYIENVPIGKAIKATVLHRDKARDLALIQADSIPPGTRAITLAKDSPRQGTTVWNIGSPGAVEQLFSITEGKVRSVGVEEHRIGGGGEGFTLKAKVVTATNPVNPGDSGGPLFNKKGQQVAVTESGHTRAQQVNMFVDVTEVRAFLAQKKITITEPDDEPKLDKPGPKPDKFVPKKDDAIPPKTDTPPAKDPTPPAANEADEKAAAARLASARLFKDGDENREVYKSKLNAIIKQYPNTAAAKEAKKLLDGLK